MSKKLEKGFTLVELIIVMSIISLLVTLGVVSYRAAQTRAKDTAVRRSNLKAYQNALEVFAGNNNTLYPHHPTAVRASTTLCAELGITNCPEDPRPDSEGIYYMYITNGSGVAGSASATTYVLYARLEESNDYWIVCTDGHSGTIPATTAITTGTCPL